jgi:hypothetical protein
MFRRKSSTSLEGDKIDKGDLEITKPLSIKKTPFRKCCILNGKERIFGIQG